MELHTQSVWVGMYLNTSTQGREVTTDRSILSKRPHISNIA